MCLSDAYELKNGERNLVCSRVCGVSADGENVTLTDLMGIRTVVSGKLKSGFYRRNGVGFDNRIFKFRRKHCGRLAAWHRNLRCYNFIRNAFNNLGTHGMVFVRHHGKNRNDRLF